MITPMPAAQRRLRAAFRVLQHQAARRLYVQPLRGQQKDVGRGLAACHLVAGRDGCESLSQSSGSQQPLDGCPSRGAGYRLRDLPRLQIVQQRQQARLERRAAGFHLLPGVLVGAAIGGLQKKIRAIGRDQQAVGALHRGADAGHEDLIRRIVAEIGHGPAPGPQHQPLRVEHQAVHVEENGGESDRLNHNHHIDFGSCRGPLNSPGQRR
ncbi:MAG: hypothetical protein V9H69_22295 [Anaerolineae bacterium]